MSTLGPMDIGASGHWGEMGTRKNEHQGKWALGTIGANEQFGKMGVWNKWAFGKMGIWGQMGTLGSMSFGASGHW